MTTTKQTDTHGSKKHETKEPAYEAGQTGAVKDPANDGRLKENREAGITKGTTEHSAQAPHVNEE